MDTIKNITRHATHSGYGWLVRITSRGVVKRKYFADVKYGGRMKALNKAVKYRNQLRAISIDARYNT